MKVTTVYQDTDSHLVIVSEKEILPERLEQNQIFAAMGDLLDTSNFSPDNPLRDVSTAGKFGLFKSEVGDKIIREVIAISPKVYSVEVENDARIVRHKGVPKHATLQQLGHTMYQASLYENSGPTTVPFVRIGASGFINYTSNAHRSALNRCNMKRKFTSPQHSTPWGYYGDISPYANDERFAPIGRHLPPRDISFDEMNFDLLVSDDDEEVGPITAPDGQSSAVWEELVDEEMGTWLDELPPTKRSKNM